MQLSKTLFNSTEPKKRKVEKILEDIQRSKEEQQHERKRLHKEKMERLDMMNKLLERLVAAAENKNN